jgi:hypothetical protein
MVTKELRGGRFVMKRKWMRGSRKRRRCQFTYLANNGVTGVSRTAKWQVYQGCGVVAHCSRGDWLHEGSFFIHLYDIPLLVFESRNGKSWMMKKKRRCWRVGWERNGVWERWKAGRRGLVEETLKLSSCALLFLSHALHRTLSNPLLPLSFPSVLTPPSSIPACLRTTT